MTRTCYTPAGISCCAIFHQIRRTVLGTLKAFDALTCGNPRVLAEYYSDLKLRYPPWLIERILDPYAKCPCQD